MGGRTLTGLYPSWSPPRSRLRFTHGRCAFRPQAADSVAANGLKVPNTMDQQFRIVGDTAKIAATYNHESAHTPGAYLSAADDLSPTDG